MFLNCHATFRLMDFRHHLLTSITAEDSPPLGLLPNIILTQLLVQHIVFILLRLNIHCSHSIIFLTRVFISDGVKSGSVFMLIFMCLLLTHPTPPQAKQLNFPLSASDDAVSFRGPPSCHTAPVQGQLSGLPHSYCPPNNIPKSFLQTF